MPLRDFRCEACGHLQEELIRGPADEEGLRCACCGGASLSRQLSAPARHGGGGGGGGADCAPSGFG